MSLNNPKMTVGLPVYNAALFLNDCIHSILNQSFANFELLIIDDGSNDDSINIIQSFTDERITFIKDGLNKGLPNRLNQIAQLAKGDYIVRMDADDIMHKDRLEIQLKILMENPLIDVLGTNAYSINENNEIMGVRMELSEKNNGLMEVNSFIHPTIMGKKEWFKKNLYDENAIRCEDVELWFRAKQISNFYFTPSPLLFYREFGGDYYKKYIGSIKGMFYISKKLLKDAKYKSFLNCVVKYNLLFLLKCLYYYILHILGKENLVINMRNVILSNENLRKSRQDLAKSISSK